MTLDLSEEIFSPASLSRLAPDERRTLFQRDGAQVVVRIGAGGVFALRPQADPDGGVVLHLVSADGQGAAPAAFAIAAVAKAVFDHCLGLQQMRVDLGAHDAIGDHLLQAGVTRAAPAGQGLPVVVRGMLWQRPDLWLTHPRQPYPLAYTMTDGKRHPVRPPVPAGTVYRRWIESLGATFSLRTIDAQEDLSTFHRWMNDPRVDKFWEESGPIEKHAAYLARASTDPRVHALLGCFDGQPFGYFETYWAKEDRVAPYYDVDDHDRGIHMLVGESHHRGPHKVAVWLPALAHYLFLADPRTRHVVAEPRADNAKMIGYLQGTGFYKAKEFDFPHKRAAMMVLPRDVFFSEGGR